MENFKIYFCRLCGIQAFYFLNKFSQRGRGHVDARSVIWGGCGGGAAYMHVSMASAVQ